MAGDVLVGYVTGDQRDLAVVAWDLGSGEELWRAVAAPGSGTVPGIVISPEVVGEGEDAKVAYLVPDSASGWERVAIASAATGEAITSEALWASSPLNECDGAVCLAAFRNDPARTYAAYRIDPTTGVVVPDPDLVVPAKARALGDGLYATSERDPGQERLGYSADGALRWERPYESVFGPGATTDAGWSWSVRDDVLVGHGSVSFPDPGDAPVELDLSTTIRTVGLDAATGETLWSFDGTRLCPGATQDDAPVVLCETTEGLLTLARDSDGRAIEDPEELRGRMVGIDPATGEPRWTAPATGPTLWPSTDVPSFTASTTRVVVRDGDAVRIVDRESGDGLDAGPTTVLACSEDRDSQELVRGGDPDVLAKFGSGETSVPCGMDGTTAPDWTTGAIRLAGIDAGDGRFVVRTPEGYALFAPESAD